MVSYKLKSFKIKIRSMFSEIIHEYNIEIKGKRISKTGAIIFCIGKIMKNPKIFFDTLTGKRLNIPYVEIVLTTVCTLKCKGCSALMGYYDRPEHIDVNKNIKTLRTLIESVDYIGKIRLLGGEPLCYPNLYEILTFLSTQDKVNSVEIVTNGTLLINDNKVLEILKNKKFIFYISKYVNASRKYNELIEQLKNNNIQYVTQGENNKWVDYGGFNDRKKSKRVLKKQFLKCNRKKLSILNGKLFQCYRCSHATNLNLIELKKEDYIDLLDEKNDTNTLRKKIYKFIYGYVPYVESCKYCDCTLKNKKLIERGEQ